MANKNVLLTIPIIILVIGMTVVGCDIGPKDDGDPTYSVWTAVMNYTDFQAMVRAEYDDPGFMMNDRSWWAFEFGTPDRYNQVLSFLNSSEQVGNKTQNNWTKNQLIDYFIGRGADNAYANEAASQVITSVRLGLAGRRGSLVYMLIK